MLTSCGSAAGHGAGPPRGQRPPLAGGGYCSARSVHPPRCFRRAAAATLSDEDTVSIESRACAPCCAHQVLTLKTDTHFWPTYELRLDPCTAQVRRRSMGPCLPAELCPRRGCCPAAEPVASRLPACTRLTLAAPYCAVDTHAAGLTADETRGTGCGVRAMDGSDVCHGLVALARAWRQRQACAHA